MYQLITNDVGQSEDTALKCASDIISLASETKKKANNVIISYSPPCGDNKLNDLVYTANCGIDQSEMRTTLKYAVMTSTPEI